MQMMKTVQLLEGWLEDNDEFEQNEREHGEALRNTGFWGKAGAGCLIIADDTKRVLVPFRSRDVQQPNTWGVWGGAIDNGKNPEQAVQQEVREEAGYTGPVRLFPAYVFKDAKSGFQYFNFFALVQSEFRPMLNWETENYKWLTVDELAHIPGKHFGLEALLRDPESIQTLQRLTR